MTEIRLPIFMGGHGIWEMWILMLILLVTEKLMTEQGLMKGTGPVRAESKDNVY